MDIEICAGTLAELDSFVFYLEDRLEMELPQNPIPIYILSSRELLDEACRSERILCCYSPEIDAIFIDKNCFDSSHRFERVQHEIVHLFQYNTKIGSIPALFSEGMAVLFGNDTCYIENISKTPINQLLELPKGAKLKSSEYYLGALFLQFLLSQYPVPDLLNFFSLISDGDSYQSIASAFMITFNTSIDDTITLYYEISPEFLPNNIFCSVPIISNNDTLWYFEFSFECANNYVVNSFSEGPSHLSVHKRFNITQSGYYEYQLGDNLVGKLRDCSCSFPSTVLDGTSAYTTFLDKGMYLIELSPLEIAMDESSRYYFEITQVESEE